MSGSKSEKSSIRKYVPEESVILREYLLGKGIKNLERHTILIEGNRVQSKNLDEIVEKNKEIIVLPILRGG